MIKETRKYKNDNWLREEFHSLELSDERLKKRLIKIMGDFYCMPETSINVSSVSWAESKAAYRFLRMKMLILKKFWFLMLKKQYNYLIVIKPY